MRASGRPTLVIFVKVPRAGRVKTRLGREIGMTTAAWWFRHQVARLIRRVGHDRRWRTVLAVAPDHEGLASRALPAGLPRWPQGQGDLGDRMGRALRALGPGPVAIVGADVPGITAAHVARAFSALGRADLVFGPASDGGYWFVGCRGAHVLPRTLFRDVRWSTEHALADTQRSAGPVPVAMIDPLDDVDAAADLHRQGCVTRDAPDAMSRNTP
ncbi:MAG: TIGR04282 family arsenosugar biosynthesis glycosyltransferase [Pseudomonadota bacterium]